MSHARQIKNRLRIHRKSAGLTQKQVAQSLGLSTPTQISRWEKSIRLPNLRQAIKLSALYNRLVNDLFFDLFQELRETINQKQEKMK